MTHHDGFAREIFSQENFQTAKVQEWQMREKSSRRKDYIAPKIGHAWAATPPEGVARSSVADTRVQQQDWALQEAAQRNYRLQLEAQIREREEARRREEEERRANAARRQAVRHPAPIDTQPARADQSQAPAAGYQNPIDAPIRSEMSPFKPKSEWREELGGANSAPPGPASSPVSLAGYHNPAIAHPTPQPAPPVPFSSGPPVQHYWPMQVPEVGLPEQVTREMEVLRDVMLSKNQQYQRYSQMVLRDLQPPFWSRDAPSMMHPTDQTVIEHPQATPFQPSPGLSASPTKGVHAPSPTVEPRAPPHRLPPLESQPLAQSSALLLPYSARAFPGGGEGET